MESSKETQAARILKFLKENGSATNVQLNKICFRYGARLHELRKEGHIIVTRRIKEGVFDFVYRGQRDQQPRRVLPKATPTFNRQGGKQLSLLM